MVQACCEKVRDHLVPNDESARRSQEGEPAGIEIAALEDRAPGDAPDLVGPELAPVREGVAMPEGGIEVDVDFDAIRGLYQRLASSSRPSGPSRREAPGVQGLDGPSRFSASHLDVSRQESRGKAERERGDAGELNEELDEAGKELERVFDKADFRCGDFRAGGSAPLLL